MTARRVGYGYVVIKDARSAAVQPLSCTQVASCCTADHVAIPVTLSVIGPIARLVSVIATHPSNAIRTTKMLPSTKAAIFHMVWNYQIAAWQGSVHYATPSS